MKDVAPPPNAQVPQLPADVAALLAAERALPPAPGDLHARLLARVEASMALPPVAPPASPVVSPPPVIAATTASFGAGIAKVLAVLAVAGGAGWFALAGDQPPVVGPADTVSGTRTAAVAQRPVVAPPTTVMTAEVRAPVVDVPAVVTPDKVSDAPATPVEPRSPAVPVASETSLIGLARQALGQRDWRAARSQLDHHRRHYPRGLLAEERDLLLIRLAIATGREADAERLRDRFLATYPRSVHRHAVEISRP